MCKKIFDLLNSIKKYFFIIRNGLENVKQMIEQRVTQTTSDNDLENVTFEKKQYEILLSQYESLFF